MENVYYYKLDTDFQKTGIKITFFNASFKFVFFFCTIFIHDFSKSKRILGFQQEEEEEILVLEESVCARWLWGVHLRRGASCQLILVAE